jgi:hypothetical protein
MVKKSAIKSAAGSRANSANIEARLVAAGRKPKPRPPKCPKNCSNLYICPDNIRPCTNLFICGKNFPA